MLAPAEKKCLLCRKKGHYFCEEEFLTRIKALLSSKNKSTSFWLLFDFTLAFLGKPQRSWDKSCKQIWDKTAICQKGKPQSPDLVQQIKTTWLIQMAQQMKHVKKNCSDRKCSLDSFIYFFFNIWQWHKALVIWENRKNIWHFIFKITDTILERGRLMDQVN